MSNPVFTSSPIFGDPRRRKGAAAVQDSPQYGAATGYATPGGVAADGSTLEYMYGAPSATTRDTGRLTYDDVIVRTMGMFAILLTTGAFTWVFAPQLFFVGAIVGLVLGLVNAFKKTPSPALILAYAAAEGVFLGGLSAIFEVQYSGIVLQAVLATVATFAACLVLFRSGKVRVTAKSVRWLMVAMGGYMLFSLINLGLIWFGGMDGFGLREGPIGIVIGLVAVGMAAFSLIVDFDSIKRGVERGVPAKFAWSGAFGLVVTIVWIYVEFLRIFAIAGRR